MEIRGWEGAVLLKGNMYYRESNNRLGHTHQPHPLTSVVLVVMLLLCIEHVVVFSVKLQLQHLSQEEVTVRVRRGRGSGEQLEGHRHLVLSAVNSTRLTHLS